MANDLRPTNFDTYIGQTHAMPGIKVMVESAKKRGCSVGHLLFSGPPGLGKTTIAQVIANEFGSNLHFVNAPNLTSRGKLIEEIFKVGENDIFFIDEIHQLPLAVEEFLYPAIEDFTVELVVGANRNKQTKQLELDNFTLVGATTRAGYVSSPLRTRFQKIVRMKYYSVDELARIVLNSSEKLGLSLTRNAAEEVARRARGTPRTANQHLKIVRDYVIVEEIQRVEQHHVAEILGVSGIDSAGLTLPDKLYLEALMNSPGDHVGLTTLASIVDEEQATIEDTIEPFLLKEGFVIKTSRGRKITDKGIRHMEVEYV